jgi:hypothetical protein
MLAMNPFANEPENVLLPLPTQGEVDSLTERSGSGTAYLRSRDLCIPRIRSGVRVRFDSGKWDCCVNAVRHDPSWATKPWALTQVGVTVDPDEFPGSIFPNNGPWGLPDFATPVRWDGFESVTWVRTSCLDVIDDDHVIQSGQQVLMFESLNYKRSDPAHAKP